MSSVGQTPNVSQSAWQNAVVPYDRVLAGHLQENINPYAVASGLGLPVPSYELTTVDRFLADPQAALTPLKRQGITNFYAGARTSAAGLNNFRNEQDALSEDEIVPFIEQRIPPDLRQHYNLRVAEFLKGICVVAKIWSDGEIYLDIARGTLPPLTGGLIAPEFTASNTGPKNPTNKLIYYGKPLRVIHNEGREDERVEFVERPLAVEDSPVLNSAVREAIWRGIGYLPVQATESDIHKPRLPGRYELAIVDHGGVWVPIFADAQPLTKSARIAGHG